MLGAAGGRVEPVPGCDALALDLHELWAEIDGLGEEEEEPDEAEG